MGEYEVSPRQVVVIVGPAPGQAGGVSSVMSYLKAEASPTWDLIFLDTLKNSRWSITAFLRVILKFLVIISGCRLQKQPLVVHLNVASKGSTYRKLVIAAICRLTSTPYLCHLHGAKYRTFYDHARPLVQKTIRVFFKSAARVIVLGSVWKDFVVKDLRVEVPNVVVIPNGTPSTSHTRPVALKQKKVRIVFSGRLERRKGVAELIEAADRVSAEGRDFELVLMGDSRDAALLAEVESRPYCNVTGWLPKEEVVRTLATGDVYVLPSFDEGLPMAMLEAMSLGLPVVVTRVGAIPDVIEDGKEGYLLAPGDVSALTTALGSLIADATMRNRMGSFAFRRWQSELDSVKMSRCIEREWKASLAL